jgi:hypothetical protein
LISRCFAVGILVLLLILVFSMFSFDGYPAIRARHLPNSVAHRFAGLDYGFGAVSHFISYESMLQDSFSFNINASDVIVFLHIQKTGAPATLGSPTLQQGCQILLAQIATKMSKKLN